MSEITRNPGPQIGFALAAFFSVGVHGALAAGFEILVPHRAVYDVKLENAEDRSGIRDMNGRIVYEVKGNECEGISIRYRFVTNVTTNSDLFITDQQTSTYESPDGKEFSFQTKSFVNEIAEEKVEGSAKVTDEATLVKLTGAQKRELELAKSIFVTTNLVQVINGAKSGERLLQRDIFDGSGKADEVVRSTSVIGNQKVVSQSMPGETEQAAALIESQKAWPVTTSYFKREMDNTSESLPIYEASFLLYENGVSRDLKMNYPDYSLSAALTDLKLYDKTTCN